MNLVDMILGTLILAGIAGVLIFRFGNFPIRKETYSEFKDFLKKKWKELKSGKI